jgi:tRNA(fMet)-specific endonuclease VapC
MIYALDSNTVSYFLRGEGKVRNYFKHEIVEAGNHYRIPFIVAYEIKRWLLYKPNKINTAFNLEFTALFHNVQDKAEMPLSVWEKAVDIYILLQEKGQLIGDADILIAAYSLVNDCTLVTRNAKDFGRINGLNTVDWYE